MLLQNRTCRFILKLFLFVIAWAYVVYELIIIQDARDLLPFNISGQAGILLFSVLALMPVNWGIEAAKWKLLTGKLEDISFLKALRIIFISIVYGAITPNRSGEIPARAAFLQKENRSNGAVLTLAGSASQFTISIICGMTGLLLALYFMERQIDADMLLAVTLCSIPAFITGLLFLIRPHRIFSSIFKLKSLKKYQYNKKTIKYILSPRLLSKVILFSFLRYLVFTCQFVLCLYIFDVAVTIPTAVIAIMIVYLFTTVIPSLALAELGIRGPVALVVFSFFTNTSTQVPVASILVWIINIALPLLIGSVLQLRFKR